MPYGRRQCAAGNLFPCDYDADTFKVSSRVSSRVARWDIAALCLVQESVIFWLLPSFFLGRPARVVMSRSTADVLWLVSHFEYCR